VQTPATPPQTQTATLMPAATLARIGQTLRAATCALTEATLQDSGEVSVTGIAGADAALSLQRQVADLAGPRPVAWRVRAVDPVFCAALSLLAPIVPGGASAGAPASHGLALGLAGDRLVLPDGDPILPRLTMPDFAGELRVDYFAHDGTLAHLYPTLADPANKLAAQPSRHLAAGQVIALGDPGPGKPQWQSGEPYGTDMIIAVASSAPLRVRPAQNAEEKADGYLADLTRAIAQARAAGARVSGALLLVVTVPKAN
jgi:hypothetical protein